MKDVHGKDNTAFTVQYDFCMPDRFELEYMASDGTKKRPIVVHRSSIGAIERVMAFLIEKFAGAFPIWLSPSQVAVLPVAEKYTEYAQGIFDTLRAQNVRVQMLTDDSLGKRIRSAKTEKIPYVIVVGEKEQTSGTLTIEGRGNIKMENVPLADFVTKVTTEIKDRTCN
jgi:threonyl-tRNA synthetase